MISFADAQGTLFTGLGRLGQLIKQLRSYQTSQNTNLTGATGIVYQLANEPDIQAIAGSQYLSVLAATPGGVGSFAQQVAAAFLDRIVYRDSPRPGQSLTASNFTASLSEVVRQMQVAGVSVLAQTVTATPGTFTGAGNGVVVASVRRAFDGRVLENAYAETLTVTCTADSYTGGVSAGQESLLITGAASQSDVFAYDWPQGSGASLSLTAIDGDVDATVTNGGFASWTGNTPDSWTISVGTAGTHVFKETSIVFGTSSNALRIVGDGSNLTTLYQAVDLDTLTQYACNVWMRRDGVAPAAGTLVVELTDTLGNVVEDEAGTDCSFSIDLTTLSTNFAAYNGVFRTPRVLPSTVWLRLRLSVALTSGRAVYLDDLGFGGMSQLYVGGPFLAVFSGDVPFEVGDFAQVTMTNSRGAAGTLDTWQTLFFRLFPLAQTSEVVLPSSASPTIPDSMIP